MNVLEAIKTRRSTGFMAQTPVPMAHIETILQAGCWAPTHKRTDPWRFHVFMGEGRAKLAQAIKEERGEKAGQKVYRAPVVIAVVVAGCREETGPPLWEEHAAVAAAVQNMALAAHGLGLAGIWRTGAFTELEAVKSLLQVDASYGDRIMAFFYVGAPVSERKPPERAVPSWQNKTIFYR